MQRDALLVVAPAPDAHSAPDRYRHANSDSDMDSNTHNDGNADTFSYGYSVTIAERDPHRVALVYAEPYAYRVAHTYLHRDDNSEPKSQLVALTQPHA